MDFTIKLQRLFKGKDSSLGVLYVDSDAPMCFIIEDEKRDVKVAGETRIPAGIFQIKKRIADSPLTIKYRNIYPSFFDYHLELQNVPGFKYVYMHHGNTEKDTAGCLLCNYNALILGNGEYVGGRSRDAFRAVYTVISKMLDNGNVFIDVSDEYKHNTKRLSQD